MPKDKNISKKQYILAASKIADEEGLEALSIRRLGKYLGCNSANLYRYFDGLDELCMYVALTRLKQYLQDLGVLFKRESDVLKKYMGIWDCFCKHAFSNAPYFELLFFSKYQSKLFSIMQEYYSMFGEEMKDLGNMRTAFLQSDFDYRDYLLLDECVLAGEISKDDSVMLNRVAVNLFKGFFKKVFDLGLGQEEQDRERAKFMEALQFVFKPHIIEKNVS